ncbi:MAG: glycosyltransferase family 4 protein [Bacteroides sp.]|nr:glycosyltransferase family 4 protein [Bacteroides sp.]
MFFCYSLFPGGGQLSFFSEKGYNIHLICSSSKEFVEYVKKQRFFFKEIPILRKISVFRDLYSVFEIVRYIKVNRIDIVFGHTPKGALLSMIAAYFMQVPVRIYFRHGLVYETSVGFKRRLLKGIDRITAFLSTKVICVSPSVYQQSLADKLNSKKKQLMLFNGSCNGIDTERFCQARFSGRKKKQIRKKYNIDESAIVIGYTGRLVKDKGIIELVRCFEQLILVHDHIYLLLVGMFEERDKLPANIISLIQKSPRIICTGYVNHREIELYYSMMDIFVLPSYREGLPTSVLEASSMELPVLTTRVTGCRDSIIENVTGFFIDHTEDSLTHHMNCLIRDPSLRKQLGRNGRQFVVEKFDQKIIWSEMEQLYL